MKRKIYDELLRWKEDKQNICLTIQGQRQVGKTYIIERFAEDNYQHFIEIDFTRMPEMEKAFERAVDVDSVIKELSIRLNDAVFEPGKTLIFLSIGRAKRRETPLKSILSRPLPACACTMGLTCWDI